MHLLGSHNCARVTHFTSAFHLFVDFTHFSLPPCLSLCVGAGSQPESDDIHWE